MIGDGVHALGQLQRGRAGVDGTIEQEGQGQFGQGDDAAERHGRAAVAERRHQERACQRQQLQAGQERPGRLLGPHDFKHQRITTKVAATNNTR